MSARSGASGLAAWPAAGQDEDACEQPANSTLSSGRLLLMIHLETFLDIYVYMYMHTYIHKYTNMCVHPPRLLLWRCISRCASAWQWFRRRARLFIDRNYYHPWLNSIQFYAANRATTRHHDHDEQLGPAAAAAAAAFKPDFAYSVSSIQYSCNSCSLARWRDNSPPPTL